MKICLKCKKEKPIIDFYTRKDYGLTRNHCKECVKIHIKNYKELNSEKVKQQYRDNAKKRQERDPLVRQKSWLKSDYGISLDQYNKQLEIQNYKCYICNDIDLNKRLAVDHCHKSLKLRGLLCQHCNQALGKLKDDINLFKKAIEYIKSNGIWYETKLIPINSRKHKG